jgi:hypothetical protein
VDPEQQLQAAALQAACTLASGIMSNPGFRLPPQETPETVALGMVQQFTDLFKDVIRGEA